MYHKNCFISSICKHCNYFNSKTRAELLNIIQVYINDLIYNNKITPQQVIAMESSQNNHQELVQTAESLYLMWKSKKI